MTTSLTKKSVMKQMDIQTIKYFEMVKVGNTFLFLIIFLPSIFSQGSTDRLKYIEKYKDIAIDEMERAGIPASIKLAQGILESNSGKSYLARKANNHFGMKCGTTWTGKKVYREDDDYDENGVLQESCFRGYKNAKASYIAHSEFLRDPRKAYRYGFLFRLDAMDYKKWAHGLKKAGYATSATYAEKLISLIEALELYQYDREGNTSVIVAKPPALKNLSTINDVKYIVAESGDTPASLAQKARISVNAIMKYNEGYIQSPKEKLDSGTRIFIQKKRNFYRGRQLWHFVKNGDSMASISQKYGMKLRKLYKKNKMQPGMEPATGERIKLRWWRGKRPKLRSETIKAKENQPELIIDDENEEIEMEESSEPDFPDPIFDEEIPADVVPPEITIEPDPIPDYNPPVIEDDSPTIPPSSSSVYYVVQSGDTLYSISRKHNVSVPDIKRMNNLPNNLISKGQRLKIRN